MMLIMLTDPFGIYTATKDSIRTFKKTKVTKVEHNYYKQEIEKLLDAMHVDLALKAQIMVNVDKTIALQELKRTIQILKIFNMHGLTKDVATQFFLGGHFMIDDEGAFFRELNALNGAETRFSSHFLGSKTNEKGINAGRILPEILFLCTHLSGHTYSHFQMEASPWRQIPGGGWRNYIPELQTLQNMEHVFDTVIYYLAKKNSEWRHEPKYNRSNYGWSPYTDNNPISSMSVLPEVVTK